MSGIGWFFRTALHNLLRGGQRVVVAWLCIAFGAMALVSMSSLSSAIEKMLVTEPRDQIGADISLSRLNDTAITDQDIQALENLRQQGRLDHFTLISYTSTLIYRTPASGEIHYPSSGLGINPDEYPLAGRFIVGEPGNVGLKTLLQNEGDILVTRDLALEDHLKVGDHLILSDLTQGPAVDCQIQGIVIDTPNHQGSKIYYGMNTARLLSTGPAIVNTIMVNAAEPGALIAPLQELGWQVFLARDLSGGSRTSGELMETLLNGAGILGLLVGGIGIANTMQVLINRRRKEIAVFKTVGYRDSDLRLLFGLEAGILGVAGSLTGVGLGILLSMLVVDLFSKTTTMLIQWEFPSTIILSSFLVALITTLTFAMFAVVNASRVRPQALLREETIKADPLTRAQMIGLLIILAVPLVLAASLTMGSLQLGAGVIAFALVGLVVLGGLMKAILWASAHLLPLDGLPFLRIARSSLRRRGSSLVYGMIALFVGVVCLAFGVVVTRNATQIIEDVQIPVQTGDIVVIAAADQAEAVRQVLDGQPVDGINQGWLTPVQSIRDSGQPDLTIAPVLIGRSQPGEYQLAGAAWGSQPQGVYLNQGPQIDAGDSVEVTLWDGSTRSFPVVGSYQVDFMGYTPYAGPGILLPEELAKQVTPPASVEYFVDVPEGRAGEVTRQLGIDLPAATVVNLHEYAARFSTSYHNLFVFALAMAILALLAGALLVANSVSLAMLERHYEIGVLKAVGYSSRKVLTNLVVEYGWVALLASLAGLVAVWLFLLVLGVIDPIAARILVMTPLTALWVGALSVGLTLLTVILVTWRPTRISPGIILNNRE